MLKFTLKGHVAMKQVKKPVSKTVPSDKFDIVGTYRAIRPATKWITQSVLIYSSSHPLRLDRRKGQV